MATESKSASDLPCRGLDGGNRNRITELDDADLPLAQCWGRIVRGQRLVRRRLASVEFLRGAADLVQMARRVVSVLVALGLFCGATLAALVGWAANWLACENEGTPACARQDLASAQFTLALVGLVPAFVLVLAALLGKRRLGIAAVVVGVPLYLAWALLIDAAVHGWDDLVLLP